jgi:hypothetical protein
MSCGEATMFPALKGSPGAIRRFTRARRLGWYAPSERALALRQSGKAAGADRLRDPCGDSGAEAFPSNLLNDAPKQHVAAIRVVPVCSRAEEQGACLQESGYVLRRCGRTALAERLELVVAREPRAVGEHHFQGDVVCPGQGGVPLRASR